MSCIRVWQLLVQASGNPMLLVPLTSPGLAFPVLSRGSPGEVQRQNLNTFRVLHGFKQIQEVIEDDLDCAAMLQPNRYRDYGRFVDRFSKRSIARY